MPNLDECQTATSWHHAPFAVLDRPLHHGSRGHCHRCKIPIWWDSYATDDDSPWIGRWRAHKISEWP